MKLTGHCWHHGRLWSPAAYPRCWADVETWKVTSSDRDREEAEFAIPRSLLRSNMAFLLDSYPLRSLAVAVLLCVGAVTLDTQWAWLAFLALGPAVVISEVWHTQDYVSRTHVVRRRGILGLSRREIPLREVSAVRVRVPGLPELANQRDLEVHGKAMVLVFLGVKNADAIAERIKALAERAGAKQSPEQLSRGLA
jgi:hypothetical protein